MPDLRECVSRKSGPKALNAKTLHLKTEGKKPTDSALEWHLIREELGSHVVDTTRARAHFISEYQYTPRMFQHAHIYIYIYMYIHMYTYIYVQMYIHMTSTYCCQC